MFLQNLQTIFRSRTRKVICFPGRTYHPLKFQAGDKINFTVVAGYRQWLKFDRQVRKGQHGFWIFIPAMIKTRIEENGSSRTVEEFDRFLMAKVLTSRKQWISKICLNLLMNLKQRIHLLIRAFN